MAFRIPFSEHLVIEADTPAEVRALIAEFGVALSARALPASPPTAAVIDTGACAPAPRRANSATRRPARRAGPDDADTTDSAASEFGARLLKTLEARGELSTGELAREARGTKRETKRLMDQLATKGLVHSTGLRRGQRWHLGAKGASRPKEAESRRR
jgi:hypothetical protein